MNEYLARLEPEAIAVFDRMIKAVNGVERKGATMVYCSVNGNVYAMINKASVIGLRLSPEDRNSFVLSGGTAFESVPGFPTKDYVTVPRSMYDNDKALHTWFRLAHTYAERLPPNPIKMAERP